MDDATNFFLIVKSEIIRKSHNLLATFPGRGGGTQQMLG